VKSAETRVEIAGAFCIALCGIQFLTPLLEAVRAYKTCNASKLSLPLAATGMFCCAVWWSYGLATNQLSLWLPNAAATVLSAAVCAVRLCVGRHSRRRISDLKKLYREVPPNAHAALIQARDDGEHVIIRASAERRQLLIFSDVHTCGNDAVRCGSRELCCPDSCPGGQEEAIVGSAATRFKVVALDAVHGSSAHGWSSLVALQAADNGQEGAGRFLHVLDRASAFPQEEDQDATAAPAATTHPSTGPSTLGQLSGAFLPAIARAPSLKVMAAVTCAEPGERGFFLPVETFKRESEYGVDIEHSEAAVAFWNPSSQVFMRLNEGGELDCSAEVHDIDGRVALPKGFILERFSVQHPSISRAAPIAAGRLTRTRSADESSTGTARSEPGEA